MEPWLERVRDKVCEADVPIIRSARIVRIAQGVAWFDIGQKTEAPIPLSEWADEAAPSEGDKCDVYVADIPDVDDRYLKITRVHKRFQVGQTGRGEITRRISGGFLVDVGVNAFLSEECATDEMLADDGWIGRTISWRITSIDEDRRQIRIEPA